MPSVFLLGATGYIGGALLRALKQTHPHLAITALVRKPEQLTIVRAAGAETVLGSFSDRGLIVDLAKAADIVINAADCDNVQVTEDILSGLRTRYSEGRGKGVLLHTSGAHVFTDGRKDGKYDPDGKVHCDMNEEDIKSITPDTIHGPVDTLILKADSEAFVSTFVVCPSGVYGVDTTGPVPHSSVLFHISVKLFLDKKEACYVGEGSAIMGMIHINDLVALYLLLFPNVLAALETAPLSSPYARYYIANTLDAPWKEIMGVIARAMHARGALVDPIPRSRSVEDAGPLAAFLAANSLVRAERAHAELGWTPKVLSLEEAVTGDVDSVLASLSA